MSGQADTATTAEARTPAHAAHHLVEGVARVLTKPRFRGWIHVYSANTAATITMFTVSATYHRVNWKSATARNWMKRADHSMIFVFIAGSYTPFALLALPAHDGRVVLSIVWGGAIAGILLKMCWPAAPRSVGVPLYLLLGWVAVWYTATILHNAGVTALVLLFVGGALYSIGGILYAVRWPDPWPTTFGYHEFFHACTAVAAICHYIAMWFVVF
ncbi:PAQR family membrane homeostasis protein TrhA [Mycobacterium tuberculosis]|uniref:PAQR family membrane homeostasis protein TrhA n=1 Tax=Mycobacterium tuberculosis TaxID=1773 RepID=UPI00061C5617|nr:hemolysin III family protein [Mycobacterium tuberculosis]CKM86037.1 hemolysin [Mycobacterium tuberculosis]